MFPTPVGMNRELLGCQGMAENVPHARGDEPLFSDPHSVHIRMFPTPVGMNRYIKRTCISIRYVPHARGDEPARR